MRTNPVALLIEAPLSWDPQIVIEAGDLAVNVPATVEFVSTTLVPLPTTIGPVEVTPDRHQVRPSVNFNVDTFPVTL